jgi:hypothetical protein
VSARTHLGNIHGSKTFCSHSRRFPLAELNTLLDHIMKHYPQVLHVYQKADGLVKPLTSDAQALGVVSGLSMLESLHCQGMKLRGSS